MKPSEQDRWAKKKKSRKTGIVARSLPKEIDTMPLTLQLFGALVLHRDGVPLPRPRVRKDHWLLALLVLRSDRDTARSFLAGTFWPDVKESQALFYLRRSLNELRQVLGPDAVRLTSPTPRTLRLDP